jgi:hypothetical protein
MSQPSHGNGPQGQALFVEPGKKPGPDQRWCAGSVSERDYGRLIRRLSKVRRICRVRTAARTTANTHHATMPHPPAQTARAAGAATAAQSAPQATASRRGLRVLTGPSRPRPANDVPSWAARLGAAVRASHGRSRHAQNRCPRDQPSRRGVRDLEQAQRRHDPPLVVEAGRAPAVVVLGDQVRQQLGLGRERRRPRCVYVPDGEPPELGQGSSVRAAPASARSWSARSEVRLSRAEEVEHPLAQESGSERVVRFQSRLSYLVRSGSGQLRIRTPKVLVPTRRLSI